MNTATVSLLLAGCILAGFGLAMLMLAAFSVVDTPRISGWRKARLLRQLPELRLHRQLQRMRIDVPGYTAALRTPALKRQMQRCTACEATAICDHADGSENLHAFCPNAAELSAAARTPPPSPRRSAATPQSLQASIRPQASA